MTDPEPFDVRHFARMTIMSGQMTDEALEQLEDRVARIEECIAARWPRRWLLMTRLRREIRASVHGWDKQALPGAGFRELRYEWCAEQLRLKAEERGSREDEGHS